MSMGMDRLEELGRASQEARELLRDIRSATKDLRQAMKEAKELVPNLVEKRIEKAFEEGLDEYKSQLGRAIKNATEAVYRRFDTLADILLGENGPNRAKGEKSIPEMVREAVKKADQRGS